MENKTQDHPPTRFSGVQTGLTLSVLLATLLIGYGLLRYPTTLTASSAGVRSLAGSVIALYAYEAIALWGVPATSRAYPALLRMGVIGGILIGFLFAAQMLIEYLTPLTSDQDGTLAFLTFGTLFVIFFLAGLWGAKQTGRIRLGLLAALWSALVGSLIWLNLVLITYYAFNGTPQERHFLEIDQTLADFQHSGMTDLRAFILQDYLGGGFFHLLLSPISALIFGSGGSLVDKVLTRLRKPFD